MELLDKLTILTDAAKYDAACTSSGVRRGFQAGKIGNTSSSIAGCCHSFSADGRCITLLKVLMTNCCAGSEPLTDHNDCPKALSIAIDELSSGAIKIDAEDDDAEE